MNQAEKAPSGAFFFAAVLCGGSAKNHEYRGMSLFGNRDWSVRWSIFSVWSDGCRIGAFSSRWRQHGIDRGGMKDRDGCCCGLRGQGPLSQAGLPLCELALQANRAGRASPVWRLMVCVREV
ncbi:MAG: hypothetical protein JXJ30_10345, partial [Halothiobacillaceae bacterium]|nr:hypothetical protein [Halothiobacillaceae bacterium]